jgi:hypothetical protein
VALDEAGSPELHDDKLLGDCGRLGAEVYDRGGLYGGSADE